MNKEQKINKSIVKMLNLDFDENLKCICGKVLQVLDITKIEGDYALLNATEKKPGPNLQHTNGYVIYSFSKEKVINSFTVGIQMPQILISLSEAWEKLTGEPLPKLSIDNK